MIASIATQTQQPAPAAPIPSARWRQAYLHEPRPQISVENLTSGV
jgi:hypothetical protein